ncbi:MAG: hypothetical protein HZA11_04655 [Nitrospirae bacterium]|nr:hypothetical protein [Nitrospirota bacterium]
MKISTVEELNRFSISVHDLEDSQKFLSESLNYEYGSITNEALLIAAILYLARPFSANEKKKTKAISNLKIEWFSELTQKELALLKALLEIRNKCLAHAEYNFYPAGVDNVTGVLKMRRFSICDSRIDIQLFQSLLSKLIKQAHNKRADYTFEIRRKTKATLPHKKMVNIKNDNE